MPVAYSLTPELRTRLKEPIGTLIKGSFSETAERFKDLIEKENPPVIVSVGDTVTRNLTKSHVPVKLAIVDNICMRRTVEEPAKFAAGELVHVRNPQATITTEAVTAIQKALKAKTTVKIVVEGEEDLLVLIAVMYAPEDSFVLYGQPYEGIVAVKVTPEKKTEVAGILSEMMIGSKS